MTPIKKHPLRAMMALVLVALLITFILRNKSDTNTSRDVATDTKPEISSPDQRPSTSSQREGVIEADRRLQAERVATDVAASVFPIKEYRYAPAPSGKAHALAAGLAYIHVPSSGQRVSMEPNQLGEYPPMDTRTQETVGVRIALDDVPAETPVRLVILDGGSFPAAEGFSRLMKAQKGGVVAFEYTTSANTGTHRILVQAAGYPSRILDFTAHTLATP